MGRSALILGASGLVGSSLLQYLLEDPEYDKVIALVRKKLEFEHPKLDVVIANLLDPEAFKDIRCDDLFCCIGTTQDKTPDLSEYRRIDYGIPVHASEAALRNGLQKCFVISSMGADEGSRTFYLKTKGQMERALREMGIPELYVLRPSLLLGQRNEFRFGERLSAIFMKIFRFLIPARYRAIDADSVARCMMVLKAEGFDHQILSSDEIFLLSKKF